MIAIFLISIKTIYEEPYVYKMLVFLHTEIMLGITHTPKKALK